MTPTQRATGLAATLFNGATRQDDIERIEEAIIAAIEADRAARVILRAGQKTPKQQAAKIYDQYWGAVSRGPVCKTDELPDMRPLLEQAIIAAIEAEREACAKVLDDWAEVNKKHDRLYESEIMKTGAQSIRARANS